jgi:hypothetical protein
MEPQSACPPKSPAPLHQPTPSINNRRADAGQISLRMSQFTSLTTPIVVRPALDVVFNAGAGWAYPPSPPPPPPPPSTPDLGNTDPQPPAARNPDGSCAPFPGSFLQLDVSQLPVHQNSL